MYIKITLKNATSLILKLNVRMQSDNIFDNKFLLANVYLRLIFYFCRIEKVSMHLINFLNLNPYI